MQINTISMTQPVEWLKMSWTIFTNNPLQWLLILIVFLICSIISNLIPLVGSLIYILISPALMAGIFLAAQKSANGEAIEINDLFAVILDSEQRKPFLLLGVLVFIVNLLVMAIILVPMLSAAGLGQIVSDDGQLISSALAGAGFLLLIPLTIIYLMAMVYAIPLMLFSNQGIKQALLLSLKASASNILPMLLLSVIYLILIILAMIPMGLGLLVLFPVTIGLIYVSYKDIFS